MRLAPAAEPARTDVPGVPVTHSLLSRGMRETIEAIAIALALAFLFKTFEAEAFVIPTGSMAPTLMGRHKDVNCPQCGYQYTASGSDEADRNGNEKNDPNYDVVVVTCPICRMPYSVDPQDPDNAGREASPSYSGDRIWVSKVPYHFSEPKRFDVAVFRFPDEAETYYIKRLVGLPEETLRIYHGDLWTKGADQSEFSIVRKPPDKVLAMAQIVHDNDCASPMLIERGWPPRWQSRPDAAAAPTGWQASEDTRRFQIDGTSREDIWLRYQHIVPSEVNWLDNHWPPAYQPRPQLITDFYAFNARELRHDTRPALSSLGLHWVGDLLVECELDAARVDGSVRFDLVEGGRHFGCKFDLPTGQCTLSIDGLSDWQPTATTAVKGIGNHRVRFANVDRQLLVWVDDRLIAFDRSTTYDDLHNEIPKSTADDPGDLSPVGIASRGAAVSIDHLRVLRDIYYIADSAAGSHEPLNDYYRGSELTTLTRRQLANFFATPADWHRGRFGSPFEARQAAEFPLAKDQFFMLGDNSPASSDARLWPGHHYVERELLVGKALCVYWPHPLRLFIPGTDRAVPVIPNVSGMGLIR